MRRHHDWNLTGIPLPPKSLRPIAFSLSILLPGFAYAAEISTCPPPVFYSPLPPASAIEQEQLVLSSDGVTTRDRQRFIFEGAATLRHQEHELNADTLNFDKSRSSFDAQGNIVYRGSDFQIRGQRSVLNLQQEFVDIDDATYFLIESGARGQTQNIHIDTRATELENANYTTCAGDNPAWQLKADSIEIRQRENYGEAHNVSLKFGSVPVLYLPYINFPLGQRKTGLLTPTFSNTSKSGLGITAPVYWNIAPNYDATITPRLWQKRGAMLETEGRYLFSDHEGSVHAHSLPQDEVYGDSRYLLAWIQSSRFGERHFLDLNLKHSSDQAYFRDLGSSLDADSQVYLDRRISWTSFADQWQLHTSLRDFQMLSGDTEPYRRLPHVRFLTGHRLGPLSAALRSTYNHFHRNDTDNIQRLILEPELGVSWAGRAGYIYPRARFRQTVYQIENQESQLITRQFASARLDSRLYFDRKREGAIDTLAPRLTWMYLPHSSQQNLPLIDTQTADLRMGKLFDEQRFTGEDRWGDRHELITAIQFFSTRTQSGLQQFSANLAEIFVLEDQKESLAGESLPAKGDQITALELGSQLNESLGTSAQWYYRQKDKQTAKGAFRVHYATAEQSGQLSYLFRQGWLEQVAASGFVRVAAGWNLAGRWSYSLREQHHQEIMAGIEYDNCCWSLRLSAQQYRSGTDDELNHSIGLQLELKGLTEFGSELKQEFEQIESSNGLVY